MKTNFLTWIKNINGALYNRSESYNLTDSSIYEPTEILLKDINRDNSTDFITRLQEPNPWGHPRLIEAIKKIYGVSHEDRVLITSGASIAIFLICRALLVEGDHVIIESPTYEPFLAAPESLGAEITLLKRKSDDFKIDLDQLASLVTPRTKLIIVSNLHNPSGAYLNDKELRDVSHIVRKFDGGVKVLVDEVFHDFVGDRQKPAALLDNCFISLSSLSKVYGLSILRCGWILGSSEVIEKIRHFQVIIENIGSGLTQAIASKVFDNLDEYKQYWVDVTGRNRAIVQDFATPLLERELIRGNVPSDGCIFFPRIVDLDNTDIFAQKLADHRQVYVVPGRFFGSPAHVRIGFGGKSEELQVGLKRLADELMAYRRPVGTSRINM